MQTAIQVQKVSYHYGERRALDGVELSVPKGSLYSIVGPNGGGKSTLFQILATLRSPETGSVKILGQDSVKDRANIRRQLALVFQHPALDPKLTVRENCILQARLCTRLSGAELTRRVEENAERLGVRDRLDERVDKLSGGLKRRAEIAKCLLSEPSVLLLDEPTAALDPGSRREVWHWIQELRRERKLTVLFTTHLLEEAESATEVALLDEGKVILHGKPMDLCAAGRSEIVSIQSSEPQALCQGVQEKFGVKAKVFENEVRFERDSPFALMSQVAGAFPQWIQSVRIARPRLEDIFLEKTGRRLEGATV